MKNDSIRAAACDTLLEHYGDDEPADRLVDLLTDARHWCDLNGHCFGELDRRAHQHYLAEIHDNKRSNSLTSPSPSSTRNYERIQFMGNRAFVIFYDSTRISPTMYVHWHGESIPAWLEQLKHRMKGRFDDAEYAAARFIGICHTQIDGNLSLGVLSNRWTLAEIHDEQLYGSRESRRRRNRRRQHARFHLESVWRISRQDGEGLIMT